MKPRRIHRRLHVEELEPRIAPVGFWDEMGAGSASGKGIGYLGLTPSVALATDGNPVAAWADWQNIFVKRWDGASWVGMGGSDSGGGVSNTTAKSQFPSLAIGTAGRPVLAWSEDTNGDSWPDEIHARAWNGSSWVALGSSAAGGGISNNAGESRLPSTAIAPDGNPVIASEDFSGGLWQIYLRRWNGTAWVELGGSATGGGISNSSSGAFQPCVTVGSDGQPIVAWADYQYGTEEIYLRRWDGVSWVEIEGSASNGGLSNTPGASREPSLAVAGDGTLYVAWTDTVSGNKEIFATSWNGAACNQLSSEPTSGVSNNAGNSSSPRLIIGPGGAPIVAWQDDSFSGNYEIYVRRWDGDSWVEMDDNAHLGGISNTATSSRLPAMVADPYGYPIVVWQDRHIYARRWSEATSAPIVMVGATQSYAYEGIGYEGAMTIRRVGDYTQALVVSYIVSGTATNGGDYAALTGSVTLGVGQSSANIPIVPLDDAVSEQEEFVTLSLLTSGSYVLGSNKQATVVLVDDDTMWAELGKGSASNYGISKTESDWPSEPAIAVGPSGNPVVVWAVMGDVYARFWDGTSWAELGGSASGGGISNTFGHSWYPSVVIGTDGMPVVAWSENVSGNQEIYLRKWDGASWSELGTGSASGGGISNTSTSSVSPSLGMDPNGNPVIVWSEVDGASSEIYMRRWNGFAWVEPVAGSASGGGVSNNTGLSESPRIAVDSTGHPAVVWRDMASGKPQIYLRKLSTGAWREIGTGSASGNGVSNASSAALYPAIVLATDGNPILAWTNETGPHGSEVSDIYVRLWNGVSWSQYTWGT